MKLNLSGLDQDLLRAVRELNPILRIQESDSAALLKTERTEAGFFLKFGPEIRIGWHTLPDFCRALSYLSEGKDRAEVCAFDHFGMFADQSRNGVMTVDVCKKYIRHLALMGYNRFLLYLEDIYEVEEEPYFGQYRGRYSAAEIREIEAYCDIFGIELMPCIQTLAHLNAPFKWWWYDQMRDCDDILLVGDPFTYRFLDHCIGAISKMFRSRNINVGMDEAFRMGLGKYYERNGPPDRMEMFCKHVDKVIEICRKYGMKPSMWSDMFYKIAYGGLHYETDRELDPEQAKKIPKEIGLIFWDYSQTDKAIYDKILRAHKGFGNETIFAGGAFSACGLVPFNRYSNQATIPACRSCIENGIRDVFVTQWGDNGAECSRYAVLPAMQVWAQLAYGQPIDDETLERRTRATHGVSYADFLLLDKPAETYRPEPDERLLLNSNFKFYLYNDPLLGLFDSLASPEYASYYRQVGEEIRAAGRRNPPFGYVFNTVADLCAVLELKADLGVRLKSAYDAGDRETLAEIAREELPELLRRLNRFYRSVKIQWGREHKIFGREVQDIRLAGLIQRVRETKRRLEDYLTGRVPELEELREPRVAFTGGEEKTDRQKHTVCTFWNCMPTTGVL